MNNAMHESMGWSFDVEAQFSTVASQKAELEVGALLLMHLPDEEAEEIMLFWEGRSPYTAAVEQYNRYIDLVAQRITIASAIVIQHFWNRVRDNLN
jgi:hypothetical protein